MNTYHFTIALQSIEHIITDRQRAMMVYHYNAPGHTATMTNIASAAGFDTYKAGNLQYGKLGRMVAEAMGWQPVSESPWLSALADFHKLPDDDWQITLHPTFVKALEELGWV